jgi:hypothetical protein
MRVLPLPLLLIGLLLAACGVDPTGVADVDLLDPARGELGMPTKPYSGPDLEAVELLGDMVRWQRGLTGAAYTAKVYARGAAGGTKPAGLPWAGGGEWEARTTFAVTYAKPAAYRFDTREATLPGQAGTTILLGPDDAQVRAPGLAGLLVRTRALGHADLANCRGLSLAQLTPGATVRRLGAAATARILGEVRVDDALLDLIEVPRTPAFDPEVAREVLGLERGSGALRLHQLFGADGRKVYEQLLLGLRPTAWSKLKL